MKRAAPARRAATRKEQQGLDSRRRILDAASSLMTERGFAGTSISEVSRLSGLPASSIYWHFESKEGLLGAVVEEGAQRWFESLPAPAETGGRRDASAAALLRAAAARLEKGPEFLRLMLLIALERKELDPTSLAMIRRVRRLALDRIEKIVALEGGAPAAGLARDLATLVLAAADGLFVAHHIDPRATDVAAQLELLRRALAALARRPTKSRPTRASAAGARSEPKASEGGPPQRRAKPSEGRSPERERIAHAKVRLRCGGGR